YEETGGTKNMADHVQETHAIDKGGPIKKRRIEAFMKDAESAEQAWRNRRVEDFNPRSFKRAVIRWVAHNNIAHSHVESSTFVKMMSEANPELEQAGCLPCAKSVKLWTAADFNTF
ncbi:hypothetical protein K402DRAFT_300350, partial [Aulographum hederae CBS 113979]